MAVQSTPVEKFKTSTTVLGIDTNVLMLAIVLAAGPTFLLQAFIGGVPFLLITGALFWYVYLRVAEYLIEVVPPNIFHHMLDWVITGDHLYITNDADPIPHLLLSSEEVKQERELRIRTNNAIH